MTRCLLIDTQRMAVVKVAPTVQQLEYWAELLVKHGDFRIQGPSRREWAVFSQIELGWLYLNAGGASGRWDSYKEAIDGVEVAVARLVCDDTPVEELAERLGRVLVSTYETPPPEPLPSPQLPRDEVNPVTTIVEAPAEPAKGRRKAKGGDVRNEAAPDAAPTKAAKPPKEPKAPRTPPGPGGRPSSGATGKVWDIADKVWKASKLAKDSKELRTKVIAECVKQGVNQSTAGVQYGKWKSSP